MMNVEINLNYLDIDEPLLNQIDTIRSVGNLEKHQVQGPFRQEIFMGRIELLLWYEKKQCSVCYPVMILRIMFDGVMAERLRPSFSSSGDYVMGVWV